MSSRPATGATSAAPDGAAEKKPSRDVVFVCSPTDDGGGAKVLRLRDESLSVGEVRPLKEGAPIAGEVVKLSPREGAPRLCDVEVVYAPRDPRAGKGPPKVASERYRAGWDAIFASFDESN